MTANEQQQIGALVAEVANLKDTIKDMDQKVEKIGAKVDGLQTKLATAEGGWKTAIGIGTVAGAIIGYVLQFLPFLRHP